MRNNMWIRLRRYFSSVVATGVLLSSFLLTESASALTPFGGRIVGVYVSNSTNYAYRVYLGGLSDCNGSWAYINVADDNYMTFFKVLQAAFVAGQNVTIYYTKDTDGYCHIIECYASA